MAQHTLKPDVAFARKLAENGGDSLKKCYQCATCAVACPMAPANAPYPRKEMVWASWGLKDRLLSDVDLWLCHNCGNCSELCPRGAKPADVMSAARSAVYQNLVEPKCIGKMMGSVSGLMALFAIPALLWLAVWYIRAGCNGGEWFPRAADGKIVFGQIFYGDYTIDPIFMLTFFGAVFILLRGVTKLWRMFRPEGQTMVLGRTKPWFRHVVDVICEEVITGRKFGECSGSGAQAGGNPAGGRRLGHTELAWGFIILACVTALVAVGHWGGKVIPAISIETPMPPAFPVKILANFGAILLLAGLALLTARNMRLDKKKHSMSLRDWYPLLVIWLVTVTGILAQCFRLADAIKPAFVVYYLHLVFVWMLFAYLPWSRLGHIVYRTAALVYARMYGRGS